MSKESVAKKNQGFIKKPEWPCCGNCDNFSSTVINGGFDEKNKKCTIGNFAVGKSDVCEQYNCFTIKHSRDMVALIS